MRMETSGRDMEVWLTAARPRLLRLARLRGVAPDAIEDVVQETLLVAWQYQDRLHTPDGVHRWLDAICRNVCRRYARQRLLDQQRHRARLAPYQCEEGERDETAAGMLTTIPDTAALDPLEALSRQE